MSERRIEGTPYSAIFTETSDHTRGRSYAYGTVKPPFDLHGTGDQMSDLLLDGHRGAVNQLVSTEHKTLLQFDIPDHPERGVESHEARLEVAFAGLQTLIEYLNNIESGTFNHF